MSAITPIPMPSPTQNHLLAALASDTRKRLLPYLELIQLSQGKVVHEIRETPLHVYFPTNAIIANLALNENGASTEVYMVGNEGVVGIAAFMGGKTIPLQAVVRSPGYAYRLPVSHLTNEFNLHGEMFTLLLRYTQALITQTSQTAMCNRHHSIDQQLSRILLQTLDRLTGNELEVTQETIAHLLGVRRESVTDAAGRMKQLGLIETRRGRIRILDRPGIEKLCCECYAVVRKETDRLLPFTATEWQHSAGSYVRQRPNVRTAPGNTWIPARC